MMLTCAFSPGRLTSTPKTMHTVNTNVGWYWYTGEAYLVGRQTVLQPAAHASQGLRGSALQACPALPAHA